MNNTLSISKTSFSSYVPIRVQDSFIWISTLCVSLMMSSLLIGCSSSSSDSSDPVISSAEDVNQEETPQDATHSDIDSHQESDPQDTEQEQEETSTPQEDDQECVPDEQAWSEHQETLNTFCQNCHGQTPQFGAPFALESYEDLIKHKEAVVQELTQATMPPVGQPLLEVEQRLALIDWLECGQSPQTADSLPAGGFESSRPILNYSADLPSGSDFFDLKAHTFHLPSDQSDRYECFSFEVPVSEDRFITRIETLVDDARVLHHVVLIPDGGGREPGSHSQCGDDNAFSLIYGWAPGQGALQFEEGGIRVQAGQKLTLQIHYNNRAGYDDVYDESGIRIYHSPPQGPEVTVLTLGPIGFRIPPRSRGEATGYCEVPEETQMIASFPHMHEQGVAFKQEVYRKQPDGYSEVGEDIIELFGWDFESQYVYESPVDLHEGDLVKTTCVFENQSDRPLRFGEKTQHEMCFNFAYITPPMSISFCNQKDPPLSRYEPGMCALDEFNNQNPPSIEVPLQDEPLGPLEGWGEIENGIYEVAHAEIMTGDLSFGNFEVDLEQSNIRARGLVSWQEDQIAVDLNTDLRLVLSGLSFTQSLPISFVGRLQEVMESNLDETEENQEHSDMTDPEMTDSETNPSEMNQDGMEEQESSPETEELEMRVERDDRRGISLSCGDLEIEWIWIPPQTNPEGLTEILFAIPFDFVDLKMRVLLSPISID